MRKQVQGRCACGSPREHFIRRRGGLMEAANDNIGPNTPVRLADIVSLAFPAGGMTVSGLRREASRGHLMMMRIAGKDFTTLAAIEEMKTRCLVPANQPDSGYVQPARIVKPSGSSSTVEG